MNLAEVNHKQNEQIQVLQSEMQTLKTENHNYKKRCEQYRKSYG